MPFLGKDWRSSGEQWIRTEHGWERSRALECILDNLNTGLRKENSKKKRKDSECDEEDQTEMIQFDISLCDELGWISEDETEDSDDPKDHMQDLKKLCISNKNYKTKQPHIIYFDLDPSNRGNKAPKASVSEVLNALDMPGAVRDTKRFNYVCRLVQIIINEKLNQLSGNAQRTLFMIVKQMLIQVLKSQENVTVMRKLLFDFKKKIQDSLYFYFYHIGSQKLGDKHVAKISKWQEILDNPNHKRVKRLRNTLSVKTSQCDKENKSNNVQQSFEGIPVDCKLEIMRRLNSGLDLVNLSMCNKSLNDIITKELEIWKNLCQFHFQQTQLNSFLSKISTQSSGKEMEISKGDLDWKQMYFKLKKRYGHREVYVDMVHKCLYCKSLFWREIGHPCIIASACLVDQDRDMLDIRTEPITPKRLIDLLLK